jgi:hypothetical protein
MNATNVLERVPIHTDAHGVVRVAGTRVTLDTIVDAFETGAKGTINNVVNLSRSGTPVVVYIAPRKQFVTVKTFDDLKGVVSSRKAIPRALGGLSVSCTSRSSSTASPDRKGLASSDPDAHCIETSVSTVNALTVQDSPNFSTRRRQCSKNSLRWQHRDVPSHFLDPQSCG